MLAHIPPFHGAGVSEAVSVPSRRIQVWTRAELSDYLMIELVSFAAKTMLNTDLSAEGIQLSGYRRGYWRYTGICTCLPVVLLPSALLLLRSRGAARTSSLSK